MTPLSLPPNPSPSAPDPLPSLMAAERAGMRRWLGALGVGSMLTVVGWSGATWGLSTDLLGVAKGLAYGSMAFALFSGGQVIAVRKVKALLARQGSAAYSPLPSVVAPSGEHVPMHPGGSSVRQFASLNEAASCGWQFFETAGNFGGATLPRFARRGVEWFAYEGLASPREVDFDSDRRCFGQLIFKRMDVPPVIDEPVIDPPTSAAEPQLAAAV